MYLVDTDIVIWLLRKEEKYQSWFEGLKEGTRLYISSLTVAEVYKNVFPGEMLNTDDLLKDFQVLDVNYTIAKQGGLYWNQYVKKYKNLHVVDCIIAATALKYDLMLLTLNTKHFPMDDIKVCDPLKLK